MSVPRPQGFEWLRWWPGNTRSSSVRCTHHGMHEELAMMIAQMMEEGHTGPPDEDRAQATTPRQRLCSRGREKQGQFTSN